jgi:hypothetical protein
MDPIKALRDADKFRSRRVRDWKRDRLPDGGLQITKEDPVLFLHVLPLGRLHERFDLSNITVFQPHELAVNMPREYRGPTVEVSGHRVNLDGWSVIQNAGDKPFIQIQWFRHGGTEFAVSLGPATTDEDGGNIDGWLTCELIQRIARVAFTHLKAVKVLGPYAVGITLVGVGNRRLIAAVRPGVAVNGFDRDDVRIPFVAVDKPTGDVVVDLAEAFEMLWQASGWERDPYGGG